MEVNNSFYKLPDPETFNRWRESTPDHFIFSVKASRYITHMKKLKDPREPVEKFLDHAENLGRKLGPVLFQLPPNWTVNTDRLKTFLDMLPSEHDYVFEFRHKSWMREEVYWLLRQHDTAFRIYNMGNKRTPNVLTSDFIYVRLHGSGGKYRGNYPTEQLVGWAGAFSTWSDKGRRIYCYFNNDQYGYAVKNAQELSDMVTG